MEVPRQRIYDWTIAWTEEDALKDEGMIKAIKETPMVAAGGGNATMKRIHVDYEDNDGREMTKTYVLKIGYGEWWARVKTEASFYASPTFSKIKGMDIPRVYYAYGNNETGEKQILFEDLSDRIQLGYFCGPHYLKNVGKDLPFTIIHRHFHHSNIMIRKTEKSLVVLDWEVSLSHACTCTNKIHDYTFMMNANACTQRT